MDEILASIRRIIAEEPIEPRHKFDRTATVPRPSMPSASLRDDRGRADVVLPKLPQVQERPIAPAKTAVLAPPLPMDDVLAELLEPAPAATAALEKQPQKPEPVSLPVAGIAASLAMPDVILGVPTAAGPEPETKAEPELVAAASTAHELVTPELVSAPEDETRRAEDALGALAAGLAAAAAEMQAAITGTPKQAVAEPQAVVEIAPAVIELSQVAAPDGASPAAAAAAAVAAVARVNATAAQLGARPKAVVEPSDARALADDVVDAAVRAAVIEPLVQADVSKTEALEFSEAAVEGGAVDAEPVAAEPVLAQAETTRAQTAVASPEPQAAATDLVPVPPASFEDTIATMLRPLLREWLNANMPRMVEKALKDELVSSGGLIAHALPERKSA